MNPVSDFGIENIYHFTPIHYLPFIMRSRSLKSKKCLLDSNFENNHFRSTSQKQDIERGFRDFAHLTTANEPRILSAKLAAGFPHIALKVSSSVLDGLNFSLCRYNVAKTRYLKRGNQFGFGESPKNGYYINDIQIPISRNNDEHKDLIEANYPKGTMIEVLVPNELALPAQIEVISFNQSDLNKVSETLDALDVNWQVSLDNSKDYLHNLKYQTDCHEFIARALAEPEWRGNGLEFDRV